MLLCDELLLLALDDTSGKRLGSGTNLDAALGAALLVELALAERISVAPAEAGWLEKGKITVIDTSPTDDPDLDALLAKLAEKDGQKVKNLISPMTWKPISKGLRDRRITRLVQQRVLTEERSKVLGLRSHPVVDAGPEHEVRTRLRSALVDGLTPTERTVALIALLDATGILTKVVVAGDPRTDKKLVKTRAKQLAEGDWAAKAVKDAIAEMTAVMVAASAGGAAGGGSS